VRFAEEEKHKRRRPRIASLGFDRQRLFKEAGFPERPPRSRRHFQLPTAKHYLDFIKSFVSPIVAILQRLQPAQREAAWMEMDESLHQFEAGTQWIGRNELLLTAARR